MASSALHYFSAAVLAIAFACNGESDRDDADRYARLLPFDTAHVRLISSRDTLTLTVELAETTDQHTMGLMERRALAPDAGMLFLYPRVQSERSAFWMFRTRISLDIAFVDSAGVIRAIQTMTPCEATFAQACPSYPAGARYQAALEVNAGYFARNQIRVGDRIVLNDTITRRQVAPPRTRDR